MLHALIPIAAAGMRPAVTLSTSKLPCCTRRAAAVHGFCAAAFFGRGSSTACSAGDANKSDSLKTASFGPDPQNIFARILRGEASADVVEDLGPQSELFTFRDVRPASSVHLLVIPRHFIRDASQLGPDDADLVRRMEAKARELVRREVGSGYDERELTLGFHCEPPLHFVFSSIMLIPGCIYFPTAGPPWYSVPWLHLHAIYPRSAMRRRYKYTAFSFYTPERVLRRLQMMN